jgi:hypothetical protein
MWWQEASKCPRVLNPYPKRVTISSTAQSATVRINSRSSTSILKNNCQNGGKRIPPERGHHDSKYYSLEEEQMGFWNSDI